MTQRASTGISTSAIIITLLLMSLSTLFIGLSAAYVYTRVTTGVEAPFPPIIFYITVVLLGSANYFMRKASGAMEADQLSAVRKNLNYVMLFTVIFAVAQVIGWIQFFTGENAIQTSNALAYLFVLSALHHLHVVAGIPFLGVYMRRLGKETRALNQISDHNRLYIKDLAKYWRFIDVLWVLLVLMLLISAFF